MTFDNSFSDFRSEFDGGFGEIVLDAAPHLKDLKNGIWIGCFFAAVVGTIFLFQLHKMAIFADKPFVLPLAGILICMLALHLVMKYYSYMNSFPENNFVVFSNAGLTAPAFIARSFSFLRGNENDKNTPVFLPWRDVKQMKYITVGKQRTQFLKVVLNDNSTGLTQFNIPKKILRPKLNEIEVLLRQNLADRYGEPKLSAQQVIEQIRKFTKIIPIVFFILTAFIAGMIALGLGAKFKQPAQTVTPSYDGIQKQEAIDWASPRNPVILSSMKPDDFVTQNWPNGNLKSKEPTVGGQLNGMAEYRFDNGQIYGFIPYLNGQKHGSFTLYREDGSLDQELRYKEGKVHGVQHWTNPEQTWLYIEGKPMEKLQ